MALRPFRWILGTLEGTHTLRSMYLRIPGLRPHSRLGAHGLNLRLQGSWALGLIGLKCLGHRVVGVKLKDIRV